jgi:hypothetical protein
MTAMQNRLVAMERDQANKSHHKPNDKWKKRPSPQEKRPPNPFESTNLVDHQTIPYCRPYGKFYEESTCQIFLQVCNEGEPSRPKHEQVNMFGHEYNVGMNEWMEMMEHSREVNCMNDVVDKATERFGPKPSPKQVSEMSRYTGLTYQRDGTKNQNGPKTHPPSPNLIVPTNSELNIDLGGWLNNAKILVPMAEIMKISSQKTKLLNAIEDPHQHNIDGPPAVAYQDAHVILQNWDRGNEKNQPFFLSLLVNNHLLHNCMLNYGASSNVMTKKVME